MDTPPPAYLRSNELAHRAHSKLLIVDVQEKLIPSITHSGRVIANCRRLLDGARILAVPAFATEQYPRGLGPTVAELKSRLGPIPEKLRFSCAEPNDRLQKAVDFIPTALSRTDRIAAYLESHPQFRLTTPYAVEG